MNLYKFFNSLTLSFNGGGIDSIQVFKNLTSNDRGMAAWAMFNFGGQKKVITGISYRNLRGSKKIQ